MRCEICNRSYRKALGLGIHVAKTHKLSPQMYYDRFLKQSPQEGSCLFCGKPTSFTFLSCGYNKYCCNEHANHSKIRAEKISKAKMGHETSPEARRKMAEARKGKSSGMKGRHPVPWNKGKVMGPASPEAREKNRLGQIRWIERNCLNGEKLVPRIGKMEKDCLDELEKLANVTIIRQHRACGYFLDGFIPELRLVVEFDEYWHFQSFVREQDKQRQDDIESALGFSFFRVSENDWTDNKLSIVEAFRREVLQNEHC